MNGALHLTLGCNLRCTYCYAGTKVDKSMTPEIAERALEFLAGEARTRGDVLRLTFFGGEPLVRFDLIRLVVDRTATISDVDIRFHMITNGTLLTDERIEYFRRAGVDYTLSLDGIQAAHDLERRTVDGHGSFDRIMARVPKILEADPYVKVNLVVTPRNAPYLAESVRFLHETGFRYLDVAPDFGGDWDAKSLAVLRKQYRKVADYYVDCHRKGRKITITLLDDKIRAHALHDGRPAGAPSACDAGAAMLSIAPSGRIYPCLQMVGDDGPSDAAGAIGDVFGGFDSGRRAAFRAKIAAPPDECRGCAFFSRCHNYCACANTRATGDPGRPSAFLCEHERMLIPIADRAAEILWKERNPLFVDRIYNPAHPVMSYLEEAMK